MTLALVVAGWLAGWLLAGRASRLPKGGACGGTVSVVVPARDEAARLPRLLAALAADPPDQLLVVDDGSTDGTRALAATAGATVIDSDPPPGWTGKSAACWTGAQHAGGDVLVFLDADVEPAPGFVIALAADAARTGGLVSAHPWHRVERPDEHLSATAALVAVLGAGTGRRPVGFGPAMAIGRSAYLRSGGHGAVRHHVAEDLALARHVDVPVHAHLARPDELRARMYPGGWRQLAEGWTKNLAAGATTVPPLRTALVALWITGCLSALALGPVAYLLVAVQHAVLLRRIGGYGVVTAVLWPLPMAAFLLLFLRSAVARATRRDVAWRGRMVQP